MWFMLFSVYRAVLNYYFVCIIVCQCWWVYGQCLHSLALILSVFVGATIIWYSIFVLILYLTLDTVISLKQCNFWVPVVPGNSREMSEWMVDGNKCITKCKEVNIYFTVTEQSFCFFIYLELLQVSAMVQASQSCSRWSKASKISNFFFFNLKQKHFRADTNYTLNMQISCLSRSLFDYITYGFVLKQHKNTKVHPTQKKKMQFQSVIIHHPCLREKPPAFSVSWLNVCSSAQTSRALAELNAVRVQRLKKISSWAWRTSLHILWRYVSFK